MKKILFILFLGCGLVSQAQIAPGTFRVGGNASYDRVSNEYFSGSTFQMDAVFGVFPAENFVVGFRLIAVEQNFGFFNVSQTLISPELRYYINGRIIVGALYPIDLNQTENKGPLRFEAGYAAFISDKAAFEPIVYFGSEDGVNYMGVQVGFSIYL
jgi:hypothetical protein